METSAIKHAKCSFGYIALNIELIIQLFKFIKRIVSHKPGVNLYLCIA